jgi:hypothetical protein
VRNAIFFIVLAFLLAGCNGKGPALKLKSEVDVSSEEGLPVRVMPHNQEPLPVKMVPDEIVVKAFYASLIAAFATTFAAVAAWRAAYNTRKALEKIKNKKWVNIK